MPEADNGTLEDDVKQSLLQLRSLTQALDDRLRARAEQQSSTVAALRGPHEQHAHIGQRELQSSADDQHSVTQQAAAAVHQEELSAAQVVVAHLQGSTIRNRVHGDWQTAGNMAASKPHPPAATVAGGVSNNGLSSNMQFAAQHDSSIAPVPGAELPPANDHYNSVYGNYNQPLQLAVDFWSEAGSDVQWDASLMGLAGEQSLPHSACLSEAQQRELSAMPSQQQLQPQPQRAYAAPRKQAPPIWKQQIQQELQLEALHNQQATKAAAVSAQQLRASKQEAAWREMQQQLPFQSVPRKLQGGKHQLHQTLSGILRQAAERQLPAAEAAAGPSEQVSASSVLSAFSVAAKEAAQLSMAIPGSSAAAGFSRPEGPAAPPAAAAAAPVTAAAAATMQKDQGVNMSLLDAAIAKARVASEAKLQRASSIMPTKLAAQNIDINKGSSSSLSSPSCSKMFRSAAAPGAHWRVASNAMCDASVTNINGPHTTIAKFIQKRPGVIPTGSQAKAADWAAADAQTDAETSRYLQENWRQQNLPSAALMLQRAWRSREPRLKLNRYLGLRRQHSSAALRPAIQQWHNWSLAVQHKTQYMQRQALIAWKDISTLQLELYDTVVRAFRRGVLSGDSADLMMWRLCTTNYMHRMSVRPSLGGLIASIIKKQEPRRRLQVYFTAWHGHGLALKARRAKIHANLQAVSQHWQQQALKQCIRFWHMYTVARVCEQLQLQLPVVQPRLVVFEEWLWRHERRRQLRQQAEHLAQKLLQKRCFGCWLHHAYKMHAMHQAFKDVLLHSTYDLLKAAMSAFKAHWKQRQLQRGVLMGCFACWLDRTRKHKAVAVMAAGIQQAADHRAMMHGLMAFHRFSQMSRLLSTAGMLRLWLAKPLALGHLHAWLRDSLHMTFYLCWWRWKQKALARLRFKAAIGMHMYRAHWLDLELAFAAWWKVTALAKAAAPSTKAAPRQKQQHLGHGRDSVYANLLVLDGSDGNTGDGHEGAADTIGVGPTAELVANAIWAGTAVGLHAVSPTTDDADDAASQLAGSESLARADSPLSTSNLVLSSTMPASTHPASRLCTPATQQDFLPATGGTASVLEPTTEATTAQSAASRRIMGACAIQPSESAEADSAVDAGTAAAAVEVASEQLVFVSLADCPVPCPWRGLLRRSEVLMPLGQHGSLGVWLAKVVRDLRELEGNYIIQDDDRGADGLLGSMVFKRRPVTPALRAMVTAQLPMDILWRFSCPKDYLWWQRVVGLAAHHIPHPDSPRNLLSIYDATTGQSWQSLVQQDVQPSELYAYLHGGSTCCRFSPSTVSTQQQKHDSKAKACLSLWPHTTAAGSVCHAQLVVQEARQSDAVEDCEQWLTSWSAEDRACLCLLWQGEELLETAVHALLGIGCDSSDELYDRLRMITRGQQLHLQGDLLTWLLSTAVAHDIALVRDCLLRARARDGLLIATMELRERAVALHLHIPHRFTLTGSDPVVNTRSVWATIINRVEQERDWNAESACDDSDMDDYGSSIWSGLLQQLSSNGAAANTAALALQQHVHQQRHHHRQQLQGKLSAGTVARQSQAGDLARPVKAAVSRVPSPLGSHAVEVLQSTKRVESAELLSGQAPSWASSRLGWAIGPGDLAQQSQGSRPSTAGVEQQQQQDQQEEQQRQTYEEQLQVEEQAELAKQQKRQQRALAKQQQKQQQALSAARGLFGNRAGCMAATNASSHSATAADDDGGGGQHSDFEVYTAPASFQGFTLPSTPGTASSNSVRRIPTAEEYVDMVTRKPSFGLSTLSCAMQRNHMQGNAAATGQHGAVVPANDANSQASGLLSELRSTLGAVLAPTAAEGAADTAAAAARQAAASLASACADWIQQHQQQIEGMQGIVSSLRYMSSTVLVGQQQPHILRRHSVGSRPQSGGRHTNSNYSPRSPCSQGLTAYVATASVSGTSSSTSMLVMPGADSRGYDSEQQPGTVPAAPESKMQQQHSVDVTAESSSQSVQGYDAGAVPAATDISCWSSFSSLPSIPSCRLEPQPSQQQQQWRQQASRTHEGMTMGSSADASVAGSGAGGGEAGSKWAGVTKQLWLPAIGTRSAGHQSCQQQLLHQIPQGGKPPRPGPAANSADSSTAGEAVWRAYTPGMSGQTGNIATYETPSLQALLEEHNVVDWQQCEAAASQWAAELAGLLQNATQQHIGLPANAPRAALPALQLQHQSAGLRQWQWYGSDMEQQQQQQQQPHWQQEEPETADPVQVDSAATSDMLPDFNRAVYRLNAAPLAARVVFWKHIVLQGQQRKPAGHYPTANKRIATQMHQLAWQSLLQQTQPRVPETQATSDHPAKQLQLASVAAVSAATSKLQQRLQMYMQAHMQWRQQQAGAPELAPTEKWLTLEHEQQVLDFLTELTVTVYQNLLRKDRQVPSAPAAAAATVQKGSNQAALHSIGVHTGSASPLAAAGTAAIRAEGQHVTVGRAISPTQPWLPKREQVPVVVIPGPPLANHKHR